MKKKTVLFHKTEFIVANRDNDVTKLEVSILSCIGNLSKMAIVICTISMYTKKSC